MYKPLKTDTVIANVAATALDQTGIGDKQLVYLAIQGHAAETVTVAEAGGGTSVFPVPATEDWLYGPVLGEDIENVGIECAAGPNTVNVTFVAGRPQIDVRPRMISVDEFPIVGLGSLPLVWR